MALFRTRKTRPESVSSALYELRGKAWTEDEIKKSVEAMTTSDGHRSNDRENTLYIGLALTTLEAFGLASFEKGKLRIESFEIAKQEEK